MTKMQCLLKDFNNFFNFHKNTTWKIVELKRLFEIEFRKRKDAWEWSNYDVLENQFISGIKLAYQKKYNLLFL